MQNVCKCMQIYANLYAIYAQFMHNVCKQSAITYSIFAFGCKFAINTQKYVSNVQDGYHSEDTPTR